MRAVRRLSEAVAEATAEAARPRIYHGACACGTVRFRVEAEAGSALPCICARCRGLGLRIVRAARADFRLLTGAEDLTEPMTDARTPHHFFCARCGEAAFGWPGGPDGADVTVNAALMERGDPGDIDEDAGIGP